MPKSYSPSEYMIYARAINCLPVWLLHMSLILFLDRENPVISTSEYDNAPSEYDL
jgi:hypothetical protein